MDRNKMSVMEMSNGLIETYLIKHEGDNHLATMSSIECCKILIEELKFVNDMVGHCDERIMFWKEVKIDLEQRI
jgi:hypothetical protein